MPGPRPQGTGRGSPGLENQRLGCIWKTAEAEEPHAQPANPSPEARNRTQCVNRRRQGPDSARGHVRATAASDRHPPGKRGASPQEPVAGGRLDGPRGGEHRRSPREPRHTHVPGTADVGRAVTPVGQGQGRTARPAAPPTGNGSFPRGQWRAVTRGEVNRARQTDAAESCGHGGRQPRGAARRPGGQWLRPASTLGSAQRCGPEAS